MKNTITTRLILVMALLSVGCAKVSGEKSKEQDENSVSLGSQEHFEDRYVYRNSETNEILQTEQDPSNFHEKYTYLTGSPVKWNSTIRWWYNPAGQPSFLSTNDAVNTLIAATQKWSQVCGVTFAYQGTTSTSVSTSGCNGSTVVGWGPLSGSTIGYTQACFGGSGFNEFDLVLDNESPLQINSFDMLQKVATHEFGHAFGMGHTDINPAVMTPFLTTGTPVSDDIQGCQSLYGPALSTPPPPPPTTTTTTLRPITPTTTTLAPAPGWTFCANEGGNCGFTGTRSVRYGANGVYNTKSAVTGSIACTNGNFGDPIPGIAKRCEYSTSTVTPPPTTTLPPAGTSWTRCAGEGGTCSFSGTRTVRYGVNGSYVTKTVTGTTACTNEAFGRDPAFGTAKFCDYSNTTTTTPTVTWTDCANEGGTCSVSGTREVRYGANGSYRTRIVTGSIACTNSAFGGDPIFGIAKKCQFSSVSQ